MAARARRSVALLRFPQAIDIMLNLKFEDDKMPPRMPNGGSGTAVFEGNREGYGKLEGVRIKEFHL